MPPKKVSWSKDVEKSSKKQKNPVVLFNDALKEWNLDEINSLLNYHKNELKDCLLKNRIDPTTQVDMKYNWLVTLLYNINVEIRENKEADSKIYQNIVNELIAIVGEKIILEVISNLKIQQNVILSEFFLSTVEALENTFVSNGSVNESETSANNPETDNSTGNQLSNNAAEAQKRASEPAEENPNTKTSNQDKNSNDTEEEYVITNEFLTWFNSLSETIQDALLKSSHIQELIAHFKEAQNFFVIKIVTELFDSSIEDLHKAIWYNNEEYIQKSELSINKEINNSFEEEFYMLPDFDISSISNAKTILPTLPQEFLSLQPIFINLNYNNDAYWGVPN